MRLVSNIYQILLGSPDNTLQSKIGIIIIIYYYIKLCVHHIYINYECFDMNVSIMNASIMNFSIMHVSIMKVSIFYFLFTERLTDRDKFMSAEEAREFGMVDSVLAHHLPPSESPDSHSSAAS